MLTEQNLTCTQTGYGDKETERLTLQANAGECITQH